MDLETHKIMNAVVRAVLPSSTVIALTHRLQGIEMYDLVIKMEAGKVVWSGPPSELIV